MVYRGKPGLGCELCRKRRLVCDRRRPSCSQCLRVGQECAGYRDPSVLRIHDQTREVTMKARAAQRTVASNGNRIDDSTTTKRPSPAPISTDERAISHIFTYHVGTTQSQGLLWYLPQLLGTQPSSALQAAMKAVGLASLAGMHKIPEFRQLAREEYGKALHATNEALRVPASAASDSTLAAVVMLSTFEMITCQANGMMRSWMNHVQGARRLLGLRGEEQFNSDPDIPITLHQEWWNYRLLRNPEDKDSRPIETLYNLLIRLDDLAIEVDNVSQEGASAENVNPLLGKALHLDTDLKLWAMSFGPLWKYTVMGGTCSDGLTSFPFYGAVYHLYRDLNCASMWNYYRQTRVVLNEIMRSMSLWLWGVQKTPESQQIVFHSISIIEQMANDIYASVPFHFTSGTPGFGAVIRLLWPLFAAALCTAKESATRGWIMEILDMIARTSGIQQVINMLQLFREGNIPDIIPGL